MTSGKSSEKGSSDEDDEELSQSIHEGLPHKNFGKDLELTLKEKKRSSFSYMQKPFDVNYGNSNK